MGLNNPNIMIGDFVTYLPNDLYSRVIKIPAGVETDKFYKVLDKYWEGDVGTTCYYVIKVANGELLNIHEDNVKLYRKKGKLKR